MITERVVTILFNVVHFLLNGIPDTIQFPQQLLNSIYHVYDIIFDNIGFLGMFIRLNTIKLLDVSKHLFVYSSFFSI